MKNCVIIGGGVIGLCTAYYLAKDGHKVTVIDQYNFDQGCSFGNAGMIVPSHMIPLAQPGMIAQGMRWMFDSKSPFYVKPRLNKDLLKWGYSFYKHANKEHVAQSMPALRDLSLLSKELFQDFSKESTSFLYEEKGLLMLFKTPKMAEEEIHVGELAREMGLAVDILNKEEVTALETGLTTDVIGGVHYTGDAHLYPSKFMEFLKQELNQLHVTFLSNTVIQDFDIVAGKILSVKANNILIPTEEVILCTGAWSPILAKKLGLDISILPGKGYSFTIENPEIRPTIPSILCEGKVAVTPMGNAIRFGGTMEITHTNDTHINMNRVEGIVNSIRSFYPDYSLSLPDKKDIWFGFRPCTPNGLPIISKSSKLSNLTVATGHAMMGLSLAPATGKIVSEFIGERSTSVKTDLFQLS